MRFIKVLICFAWCLSTFNLQGQTPLEAAYQNINKGTLLPEEILSSRTAVFLKVPEVGEDHPQHWKKLASQLHQTLVDLKVDAVAYYRWQDLNSGVDASRSYFETLTTRDISQVVVLTKDDQFHLSIVPTSDDKGFLDTQAQTWHSSAPQLVTILDNLSLAIRRAGPELANFLVIERPEFFDDTPIFTNNRFESFQPDLKLDKLAVPLIGEDDPEDPENPANQELQNIMRSYPFNYELVDYSKGEDLLTRAGFQYVLLSLNASESSVRRLLDYEDPSDDGTGIVHKFYIRHILSGDIYLGDQWDAASSKEDALRNHINNLLRSLKIE